MREGTFRRGGIWVVFVLAVGVLSVAAWGQGMPAVPPEAPLAGTATATATISSSGITLQPAKPGPGPVQFTIVNNTDIPRGLVISGTDRADTPIVRYSEVVAPGSSATVDFWFYSGHDYTLRDYTSSREMGGNMFFTSVFSTSVNYPAPAGPGRGPGFPREELNVTLTNSGIDVGNIVGGPTTIFVTNDSSRPRGLVISGMDRAGSPIIRYSRLLRPGQSTRLNFWLYGGQNYTLRDYTSRETTDGQMMFTSTYGQSFTVPEIPVPPRFKPETTGGGMTE